MSRKKPETAQIRLGVDVIESARIVAAHHGEQPGDFITEYLRPRLAEMERELMAKRARELAQAGGGEEEAATAEPSSAPKRRGRPRKVVDGDGN